MSSGCGLYCMIRFQVFGLSELRSNPSKGIARHFVSVGRSAVGIDFRLVQAVHSSVHSTSAFWVGKVHLFISCVADRRKSRDNRTPVSLVLGAHCKLFIPYHWFSQVN